MTPRQKRLLRLSLLAAVLLGLFLWGMFSGVASGITATKVRERVEAAGGWAMFAFVAAYAIGVLIHVPGVLFIVTAVALWGRAAGIPIAYIGAIAAMIVPFLLVRVVGGEPALQDIRRPRLAELMRKLTARPILMVAVLRLVFWTGPALNYGLALTPIRFRDYVIGSAIGIVPPLIGIALLFHLLFPA